MGRQERWVLGGLLVCAAALRLYGCWGLRHHLNVHAGTVALMARHISLGREAPLFFYGQDHLGSQEAWLGAFFLWLMGPSSGFAVSLGAAVTAFVLLPVVYLWARDIAGPRAGAAALAYLLIGPGGYFHYNVSPRCAYAAILTFGVLTLWLGARIAARFDRDGVLRHRDFVMLGVVAGQAWWAGPLSTPSILTTALGLLILLRTHVLTTKLLTGLLGFLAGSAPLWIHNFRHDWPILDFRETLGRVTMFDALTHSLPNRFADLMIPYGPFPLRVLAGLTLIIAIVGMTGLWWRQRRHPGDTAHPALFMSLMFLPVFALVFSLSHFSAIDAPRYLLPMVPVLAVHLGAATAKASFVLPRGTAWLPLLFLVALQTPVLPWVAETERQDRQTKNRLHELAEELRARKIGVLYAPYTHHPWNYVLEEELVFSELDREVYAPYQRHAEAAGEVALVGDHGGPRAFLAATGGKAETFSAGGTSVTHAFTPPTPSRPLPLDHIVSVRDHLGREVLDVLSDLRPDTGWDAGPIDGDEFLEIRFRQPVPVAGVRLLNLSFAQIPSIWSVRGLSENRRWVDLLPPTPTSFLFWSGPRFFWADPFFRLEANFEAKEVTALRIRSHDESGRGSWALQLLQPLVLEKTSPPDPDFPELALLLGERGIQRLYCDRWEAHRVHTATEGAIWTPRHPRLYPSPSGAPEEVRLSPGTAFLVRSGETWLTENVLEGLSLDVRKTTVGPWVLIDAPPETPWPEVGPDGGLVWTGFGLLARPTVFYATVLLRLARERFAANPRDPRIVRDLVEALERNPWLHEARALLVDVHRARGESNAAALHQDLLEQASRPGVPAGISFPQGIVFLGYRITSASAPAGESVRVSYYWEVPSPVEADRLAVFVHFLREGQVLFQDDHVFLGDLPEPLRSSPPAGVIRVEREVSLSAALPPGPVDLVLGLYDRRDGKRLPPHTDLPVRRGATVLPPPPGEEAPLVVEAPREHASRASARPSGT